MSNQNNNTRYGHNYFSMQERRRSMARHPAPAIGNRITYTLSDAIENSITSIRNDLIRIGREQQLANIDLRKSYNKKVKIENKLNDYLKHISFEMLEIRKEIKDLLMILCNDDDQFQNEINENDKEIKTLKSVLDINTND